MPMKKLATILFTATAILSFQSCKKIKGDGPTVTETRNITGFRSIRTDIDGTLHYSQSPDYSVEIRAQRNILDVINSRTINGELVIDYANHPNIGNHDHIDIYVSGPSAEGFTVGGSGDIDVPRSLTTDNLFLRINGSGSISIADLNSKSITAKISGSGDIAVNNGTGRDEDLSIDGSGSLDFLNYTVQRAWTNTAGSGTTKVNVSDHLDVTIAGSGNVYYKGRPKLSTNIFGSGKVQSW